MKTYNEFLTESDKEEERKFKENNKGREGKTLVGVDGKEISGKIYLGDGPMHINPAEL